MAAPAALGELAPLSLPEPSRTDLYLVEAPRQTEMGYSRDEWDQELRAEAAPSLGALTGMFEWYVIDRYAQESVPYTERNEAQRAEVKHMQERSNDWQGRISAHPGRTAMSRVVEQAYRHTPLFD